MKICPRLHAAVAAADAATKCIIIRLQPLQPDDDALSRKNCMMQ